MNYQKHYNLLIERSKNRILDGYSENHHIIPEHFFINRKRKGPKGWLEGDPDEPSNLVLFTPEEHFVAHQLLIKIYPGQRQLIFAAQMMTVNAKSKNQKRSNNKLYGWLKRKAAEAMSIERSGKSNGPHKPETIEKMKLAHKSRPKVSKETRLKMSESSKGKPKSKESIKKRVKTWKERNHKTWNTGLTKETDKRVLQMSQKQLGQNIGEKNNFYGKHHTKETINLLKKIKKTSIYWINNGITQRRVNSQEKEKLLQNGWKIGRVNFIPSNKKM